MDSPHHKIRSPLLNECPAQGICSNPLRTRRGAPSRPGRCCKLAHVVGEGEALEGGSVPPERRGAWPSVSAGAVNNASGDARGVRDPGETDDAWPRGCSAMRNCISEARKLPLVSSGSIHIKTAQGRPPINPTSPVLPFGTDIHHYANCRSHAARTRVSVRELPPSGARAGRPLIRPDRARPSVDFDGRTTGSYRASEHWRSHCASGDRAWRVRSSTTDRRASSSIDPRVRLSHRDP